MKQKITILLMLCLCIFAGCSSKTNVSPTVMEQKDNLTSSEEKTEKDTRPEWLKDSLQVEAGTKEITVDSLYNGTPDRDIQILSSLSEEQLRTVNGNYQMQVMIEGTEFIVNVSIVDTTAPVIDGLQELVVTLGDNILYMDGVSATDNSGESIEVTVNKANVQSNVAGVYTITYSAVDSSGNSTSCERILKIEEPVKITEELILSMADAVIQKVTTADMSAWDKAKALWTWCHDNIAYSTSSGDRTSVWTGAYEGLHKQSGDCFAYYATYEVLLTRVGIPNMRVTRINGETNHWWNLVNVGEGWYHCDCSPRNNTLPYKCFMQTDAQLEAYSTLYEKYFPEKPDYYLFDKSLYPERETKEVFDGNMHHKE